jgi:hypothetical protein
MTNSVSIFMSAEYNEGCVCLSILAALTVRREGGRTEPKGLFLYSSYLLVCLTVGKETQQLGQHRQDLIRPEHCVPSKCLCGAFP